MGYLAEVYGQPNLRLSTNDIAKSRRLTKPFVAKVLTTLSAAGLIKGSPGPGGGFRLACPPAKITLNNIVSLFENSSKKDVPCPYGPGYCGTGNPCPLHDQIVILQETMEDFLEKTTLAEFQHRHPENFPPQTPSA